MLPEVVCWLEEICFNKACSSLLAKAFISANFYILSISTGRCMQAKFIADKCPSHVYTYGKIFVILLFDLHFELPVLIFTIKFIIGKF